MVESWYWADKWSRLGRSLKVTSLPINYQAAFISSLNHFELFTDFIISGWDWWVLLLMLREICVVAEGLMTDFAEVDAGFVVHERHVLTEIGWCFAHVIALPAAEGLLVHVNSVDVNICENCFVWQLRKLYLMWTLNSPRCRNFKSHMLHSNFFSSENFTILVKIHLPN